MTNSVRIFSLALILLGSGVAPAAAKVDGGSVGCGNGACVEVWKVACTSARFIRARVIDTVNSDDKLSVTLVGLAPTALKGHSDIGVAAIPGTFSNEAILTARGNANLSAFAAVAILSNTADSAYLIDVVCQKLDGTFTEPSSLTRV